MGIQLREKQDRYASQVLQRKWTPQKTPSWTGRLNYYDPVRRVNAGLILDTKPAEDERAEAQTAKEWYAKNKVWEDLHWWML